MSHRIGQITGLLVLLCVFGMQSVHAQMYKFTDKDGFVVVACTVENDGGLAIRVADTGIGSYHRRALMSFPRLFQTGKETEAIRRDLSGIG